MKTMTTAREHTKTLNSSLTIQGWMKTDQVANYLGTSPNNIRNMIYKDQLVPKKFGGRWYFKREDIDILIEMEGA